MINKYGDIPNEVGLYAVAGLLKKALPTMIMQRFGQVTSLPKHKGDTVKWRRYERFAARMAPLAEGVPPAAQALRFRDYVATLQQYGGVVRLTDRAVDYSSDSPLERATEGCREQFAETEERLTIEVLKATANRYYSGTATGKSGVTATIKRGDLLKIKRGFERANVQKMHQMIMPTPSESTHGIPETYIAICHTDLKPDIAACTGFISIAEYGDPRKAFQGEFGTVDEFRFLCSNLITPWEAAGGSTTDKLSNRCTPPAAGANCDVYPVIVMGKDAYGVVRLQGKDSLDLKVVQPETPDSSDPLGQLGSVGWKFYWAAAILFEDACACLHVACTAEPV